MPGYGVFDEEMKAFGKFKTGKSCLYVNKLSDIDLDVLEGLLTKSVAWMRKKYPREASK